MNTNQILADLRAERDRINQAIIALESLDGTSTATTTTRRGRLPVMHAQASVPKTLARRRMSAAARKRISEAAKKRWAAQRQQAAPAAKKTMIAVNKAAPAHHGMSAAARKRMSEKMKKGWEAKKKTAKTT